MMILDSKKEIQNSKNPDISKKWQNMSQIELYCKTNKPKPVQAIKRADTKKFHMNSAAYPFNNEPVETLEDIMDYKGKKAFGVAGSGDQPFVFFRFGLKEYLAFDISQLACYWVELKHTAILNLSRDEFIYFIKGEWSRKQSLHFMRNNQPIYTRLREYLSPYAQNFFDKTIEDKNCIRTLLDDGRYFRGYDLGHIDRLPYLKNVTIYEQTKQTMKNAPFKIIWKDIDNAMKLTPNEKYDIIFISNILDRWRDFEKSFTKTIGLMKDRLVQNNEACIIGNYQLGNDAAEYIKRAADEIDLKFTKHCEGARDYWTLKHA